MPLVARDDSLLTVIDLQPRFWAERLDAEDKRCAEEAARRAAWLAAAAHALGVPAVITEEDPEINGPTDEAVLAPLRSGAPVFTGAEIIVTVRAVMRSRQATSSSRAISGWYRPTVDIGPGNRPNGRWTIVI
jgi:nicotinamidase-related amidase